jgi:uncharacterized protein YjaG (DUF416 family)
LAGEKLKSIDDYEEHLFSTIKSWSVEQRIALSAAMAERWLHVYDAFSRAEGWGDSDSLRRSLDAVWNHLLGRALSSSDLKRHLAQVEDSTPHMDDFDDESALAAAVAVQEALRSCASKDSSAAAMQSIMSGFEAVAPGWDMDPEEQPRLWKQIGVRREFKKQLALVEEIGGIRTFDDATVAALRKRLTTKDLIGEVPADGKAEKGPTGITNQTAFEQYRRMLEADLRSKNDEWWVKQYPPGTTIWAIMVFAEWASRYSRRRQTIDGSYGKLADVGAHDALVARQRALDGADRKIPDWDKEFGEAVLMTLGNKFNKYDVDAPDQPHAYGPSVRALWVEGERNPQTSREPWRRIIEWGRHRPAAWETEDKRKKKGLGHSAPELGAALGREISWERTGDPVTPWGSEVEGKRWQVRLNDFPDDYMYSLLVDGKDVGGFHDWPETWQR